MVAQLLDEVLILEGRALPLAGACHLKVELPREVVDSSALLADLAHGR